MADFCGFFQVRFLLVLFLFWQSNPVDKSVITESLASDSRKL